MAVQELNFQGINRAITDYAVSGACEELINLRPTTGGLVPVKDCQVIMSKTTFARFFIHKTGTTNNYIAVDHTNENTIVKWVNAEGTMLQELCEIPAEVSLDNIHLAYTGNIVLISICDKSADVYDNYSFLWRGEEYGYREIDVEAPHINLSLSPGTPELKGTTGFSIPQNATRQEVTDIVESALNSLQEKHEDLCFGTILIAIALKTKDGKTAFTSLWQIYNPTAEIRATPEASGTNTSFIVDSDWAYASHFPEYFAQYSDAFYVCALNTHRFYGVPLTLNLMMENYLSWDSDKSIFESVEVYVSRPRLYADPEVLYGDMKYFAYAQGSSAGPHVLLPEVPTKMLELEGQLLYLQKSIHINEIVASGNTPYPLPLKFGGNIQTTDATLEVDAGLLSRFGNVLSYNSRFHYFDSVRKEVIRMPDFSYIEQHNNLVDTDIFVVYNDGQKDIPLYCGVKSLPSNTVADIVISPSINVKSVVVQQPAGSALGTSIEYPMTASERYNYSMFVAGKVLNYRVPKYDRSEVDQDFALIEEPSAINVSEQYNPVVFKPEHSYLAPGKVLDVQPQMVAVRDVTFGDYPLNVFTDRGTYALLQGNGQVLYGNFRSMSNLVSTANSVPTEHGTFFIAAGGLWAIAGSDAVLISDALHLGPHKFIRDCAGYQALSEGYYDVYHLVSKVEFEKYVKDAILSYNRYRDELLVSNPAYAYTYVLSLKYRQWFKIDGVFSQDTIGADISLQTEEAFGRANINLSVLLSNDISLHVHMTIGLVERDLIAAIGSSDTPVADVVAALNQAAAETEGWSRVVFSGEELQGGTMRILISSSAWDSDSLSGYIQAIKEGTPLLVHNFLFSRLHTIKDFTEEQNSSILVHLQSRPFSFNGYMYTHIHRIVDMVRASLSANDLLIVALYGSDDLQDWTLLSYAGRSNVKFSQLRTSPAARSWRYYTVCIGGTIPTDTDFGPVLVDYEPVIRRLG